MKASIIAVGTELLFGQTINTNAAYLSEKLNLMGFDVMYHFVVGDNPRRLEDKLAEAFSDTDLVILTGGLGPTQDDLTKEIVAEFFDTSMYEDKRVIQDLEAFFSKRGRPMAPNNLKQALLPIGCTPLYNAVGTAPAFAIRARLSADQDKLSSANSLLRESPCKHCFVLEAPCEDEMRPDEIWKAAICLPGPPREMKWLFDNGVKQYLDQFMAKKMYYQVIRTIGIGESDLEMALLPLIDGQTDPTIATYAKEGECTLRVASQRHTLAEAQAAVNDMVDQVAAIIGDYIYSYEDEELNEVVVRLLNERGLTIAAAESCTGGQFAASITDVPGASNVIGASYVTYSIPAKVQVLGIPEATIISHGVVSEEVAIAMAEGARRLSGANIGISITGYAGPEADEGRSAGEAYIGYSIAPNITGCDYVNTSRNLRKWNRNYFRLRMLRRVYEIIKQDIV